MAKLYRKEILPEPDAPRQLQKKRHNRPPEMAVFLFFELYKSNSSEAFNLWHTTATRSLHSGGWVMQEG